MPRDQRLYMTFPIEMPEHPKIKPLSDAAFRVNIEINAYSRRLGLDGRVPVKAAHATWKRRPLAELEANHPERPTLTVEGDHYVIHDYAEHQLTTADIESLREKRAEAGSKGGKALASARANAKQTGSKPVAESESRSESELLTDMTNDSESSHVGDATGSGLDSAALRIGISKLEATRALLEKAAGHPVTPRGALVLVEAITSRAAGEINNVNAYIAAACRNSPHEVAQAYFDLDIEGVP